MPPRRICAPADLTGSERHIVPPRIAVELAERLGMFDDAAGKLRGDPAIYDLIKTSRRRTFRATVVPGQTLPMPLEPDAEAPIPYLPDVLARGAVLRDLPGTADGVSGIGGPGRERSADRLCARRRRQSEAGFGDDGGFRRSRRLDQDAGPSGSSARHGTAQPAWDAAPRALTVSLPKA